MHNANIKVSILMVLVMLLVGCFSINEVVQPANTGSGTAFEVTLTVSTYEADANAKTGILGILIPDGWVVNAINYTYDLGNGIFELLNPDSLDSWFTDGGLNTGTEWADKINSLYPAPNGMSWKIWESAEAYAPPTADTLYADITINITAGTVGGEYLLGYLFSDCSEDLMNDGDHDVNLDNAIQVTTLSVEGEMATPKRFALAQNHPNPFNPETVIKYTVEQAGNVKLDVYDINGRIVATLVDAHQSADNYAVVFKAENLPSGTYFYRMSVDNQIETRKALLLQ